jgi:hypothetical protein
MQEKQHTMEMEILQVKKNNLVEKSIMLGIGASLLSTLH